MQKLPAETCFTFVSGAVLGRFRLQSFAFAPNFQLHPTTVFMHSIGKLFSVPHFRLPISRKIVCLCVLKVALFIRLPGLSQCKWIKTKIAQGYLNKLVNPWNFLGLNFYLDLRRNFDGLSNYFIIRLVLSIHIVQHLEHHSVISVNGNRS